MSLSRVFAGSDLWPITHVPSFNSWFHSLIASCELIFSTIWLLTQIIPGMSSDPGSTGYLHHVHGDIRPISMDLPRIISSKVPSLIIREGPWLRKEWMKLASNGYKIEDLKAMFK